MVSDEIDILKIKDQFLNICKIRRTDYEKITCISFSRDNAA